MASSEMNCCVCGIILPNKWAVAKREIAGGVERYYCHLHSSEMFRKMIKRKKDFSESKGIEVGENKEKGEAMVQNKKTESSVKEREIVQNASDELVKKAWTECSSLVTKLGGGIKSLWSKINPDRSPEAMLDALNGDLIANQRRLNEMKPQLDQVYREIVSKKNEYQTAAPVRQRLLKIELQTLMARYKGLEREFTILSENERSIETVKSRFLEVLAYGKRGKLDVSMVDRLTDNIEDKVDDAEDVQDALGDLERAGRRKDRGSDDFDAELAGFDGELGMADFDNVESTNKEKSNETDKTDDNGNIRDGFIAELDGGIA